MLSYVNLIYGFPVFLILIEIMVRAMMSVNTQDFVGPTLVAASLSLLFPLTSPERAPTEAFQELADAFPGMTVSIHDDSDDTFIGLIWLMMIGGIMAWVWVCMDSMRDAGREGVVDTWINTVPNHIVVGVSAYCISATITVIRSNIIKNRRKKHYDGFIRSYFSRDDTTTPTSS